MGRAVIEGLWLRYQGMPVEEDVGRERRRRVLQTLVWFLLTVVMSRGYSLAEGRGLLTASSRAHRLQ